MKKLLSKLKENKAKILSNTICIIGTTVLLGICQTIDNTLTTFNVAFLVGMYGYNKAQAYIEKRLGE